jgi:hypothetical protein
MSSTVYHTHTTVLRLRPPWRSQPLEDEMSKSTTLSRRAILAGAVTTPIVAAAPIAAAVVAVTPEPVDPIFDAIKQAREALREIAPISRKRFDEYSTAEFDIAEKWLGAARHVDEVRPTTMAGAAALVVFALSGEYPAGWLEVSLRNAADTFKALSH